MCTNIQQKKKKKKKKNPYLPTQKIFDPLQETHLFFYLALVEIWSLGCFKLNFNDFPTSGASWV